MMLTGLPRPPRRAQIAWGHVDTIDSARRTQGVNVRRFAGQTVRVAEGWGLGFGGSATVGEQVVWCHCVTLVWAPSRCCLLRLC